MKHIFSKKIDNDNGYSFGSSKHIVVHAESIRLWQLDHNYHCAIIGTCLTMTEVKKILTQLRIGTNGYSSYELHSTIVTIIADKGFPSKKVETYLDKKFKLIVQKTKIMTAAELNGFWKAALYSGDMIGAFWGVMLHSASNDAMKKEFYGDIHMLSHMSGASNRADLKRLSQLESERKEIKLAIRAQNVRYNKLALENNALQNKTAESTEAKIGLQNEVDALKNSIEQLTVLQSNLNRLELQAQVKKLSHKLSCQTSDIIKSQEELCRLSQLAEKQAQQIQFTQQETLEYQKEVRYLQSKLEHNLQLNCPLKKLGLCGQSILYVGGQTSLVPFYRNLVEEKSGVFMYHDGGLEKNTQDLQQSLSKADVVVFPSNCISHDAYWKIKASCKKQHKPFQYLKSSGLYALSSLLDLMAAKMVEIKA